MRPFALVVFILLILQACAFGAGKQLPDRTTQPQIPFSEVETIARLPLPPANIAVSKDGRVFFTYSPQANPSIKVAEWVGDNVLPFPSDSFQRRRLNGLGFDTVLSIRIDRQNRLWALDYGSHGTHTPCLYGFDLETRELVHTFRFSKNLAPVGSMLNDFQVNPEGTKIYIADSSIFRQRSALLVYDVKACKAYRLLDRAPAVSNGPYNIFVHGKRVGLLHGLVPLKFGIDSIALDRDGEWLYFGATNSGTLYRIATRNIDRFRDSPCELEASIEKFADCTLSDGITTDLAGNIYLSDMEHSAVMRLAPNGELQTLIKDRQLRWPDGFSFGPNGWLYLTGSALDEILAKPKRQVLRKGPYAIFRFRPGVEGVPGM